MDVEIPIVTIVRESVGSHTGEDVVGTPVFSGPGGVVVFQPLRLAELCIVSG